MRFKARGVFLALVAVFAMSSITASAASAALPEFSGWRGQTFTGTHSEDTWELGGASKTKYDCKAGKITGEFTGAKEVGKVVLTESGCESRFCTNHTGGELVTNELKGHLGYIDKATREVGLLLEPATEGGSVAECTLNGIAKSKITGSIIAPISGANQKTKHFSLIYTASKGVQGTQAFEGGTDEELKLLIPGDAETALVLDSSIELTTQYEMEIIA